MTDRFTVDELALRLGVPAARVTELADRGILDRDADGRFDPGDVHRVRLLEAFEDAGVPLDILEAASRAGLISLTYYDQLHPPPDLASTRTYDEFKASLDPGGRELLARLYAAFGLAEPDEDAGLSAADETLLADLLRTVVETGQPDLALRAVRLFGEGARRSADGALGIYGEAVSRSDAPLAGLPEDELFERLLQPWAHFARLSPSIATWLTSHHMTRAIDEYSLVASERILEESGFVPSRGSEQPAVAFVDLTGFTRITQERGDEEAARLALRLGDVTTEVVEPRGGRLVKLLGDGALIRFADAMTAIDGTLDLLESLPRADLPTGHAGVASGPLIARDGDVFGRTVNLAARISDAAPDGRLYVPTDVAAALPAAARARLVIAAVEAPLLQGIGRVELVDVRRLVPA